MSQSQNHGSRPFLSVVIPCRDEAAYIEACLDSVLANDYPADRMEILVVDGLSRDGTREMVEEYARCHPRLRLLDNPAGTAPAAMNVGIKAARGDVIMRMDAHSVYPPCYMAGLVDWLVKSGADNVGCPWVIRPANDSPKARAIALGLAHPFAVGNAHYRIGISKPRWVDTVPFGCYPKKVFDRLGLFDEELVRNQDDEFNQRLVKSGGRILLIPDFSCDYYARDGFLKLWRMYYQYGYYKPLVARKLGRVMTLRQVVPGLFLASLVLLAGLGVYFPAARALLGLLLSLYGFLVLSCALWASKGQGVVCFLDLMAVFALLHWAYGLGFLKGSLDFLLLGRRPEPGRLAAAPTR
ncbi:MAG: glycosyltransferase family 2 protein [Elusimicrobia bacterium]|nr:glycosyltransferase family 2 protein [Elusimicrobiota bacterium]